MRTDVLPPWYDVPFTFVAEASMARTPLESFRAVATACLVTEKHILAFVNAPDRPISQHNATSLTAGKSVGYLVVGKARHPQSGFMMITKLLFAHAQVVVPGTSAPRTGSNARSFGFTQYCTPTRNFRESTKRLERRNGWIVSSYCWHCSFVLHSIKTPGTPLHIPCRNLVEYHSSVPRAHSVFWGNVRQLWFDPGRGTRPGYH